jgi:polyisoprenoid-binding protein YceI
MKAFWIIVGLVVLALVIGLAASDRGGVETTGDIVAREGSEELSDGTYPLDAGRSTMRWAGRKTLIPGYEDSGTIGFSSGVVIVENGAPASGEFVVDMTTIEAVSVSNDMPREMLTNHLKSADFFDVANHLTTRFVITGVAMANEEGATHTITGDLTIKGITHEISFPATILQVNGLLNAVGSISVNRADFDVRFGSDTFFDNLGDNVIGDTFTLAFDLYTLGITE